MADEKISDMPAAAALTGAELIALVQGGVNVKSTVAVIAGQSVFVRNFSGAAPVLSPTVEAVAYDTSSGNTWGWNLSAWTQFA